MTIGLDICPDCGSDSVTGDNVDIEDPYAIQPVSCDVCGCSWQTSYKFIGYSLISHGEIQEDAADDQ
jgi:hypothetical protein